MSGKNPLGKFRSKPAPSSILTFRFNPAEEDLIEEYSTNDAETTYSLQNMASFTSSEAPKTQALVDPCTDSSVEECSSDVSKDEKNTSKSDEPASPSHSTADSSKLSSRDTSPSKESLKDLFSKAGKRSSSLDYSSDPDRWSLSGIKGKIVRRFEELSKDAQDHFLERHKKLHESTSNGLPTTTKDEGAKGFSLRSQSSCDVRSQVEEVTRSPSVEEGIDCTADDIQVPYTYHVSNEDQEQETAGTVTTTAGDSSQNGGRRSTISAAVTSGAQVLLRKRTRQHSGPSDYTFSLSSLKATNSFESEDLSNGDSVENWEFVEKQSSVEEEPEEVMLCESASVDPTTNYGDSPITSHSSPTSTDPDSADFEKGSRGLLSEVKTMWQQPKWRTRLIYLLVIFFGLQVVPIGAYLSGLLTGCLLSSVLGCFVWWLLKTPLPKEPLLIPDYSTLPPLKIPPEDLIRKTSIHKGWMNELLVDYNPDTYHVNNTLSVYIRLDGDTLRLSRPKTNLPRRAMWNEPKHNPVFINQRHYCIKNASVMLAPEGMARKRLWSKKYPICISISDSQSLNLKFKDVSSDTNSSDDSPDSKIILYLFARTCREKEEWFRRFLDASSSGGQRSSFVDCLTSAVPRYSFDMPSPILEDCMDMGMSSSSNASIDYKQYMGAYMTTDKDKDSILWLNTFIGRVFYDFLTQRSWSQFMAVRIQKKLSVIKVPYFMEELKLRDINLGWCMPQVQRTCDPVLDDRGLWMDFDLTYKGTFQMTLETKLNLMKLRKEQRSSSSDKNVPLLPPVANRDDDNYDDRNRSSYLYNSDEEDSAESSSDEENSQTDVVLDTTTENSSSQPSSPVAARSGGSSTGKMVLHWVDKIAQSRYFQQATENRYIRKAMTGVSNTPLVLTVEVHGLVGTLALNLPPPPTDRLWYGFRGNPQLSITARPKLGEHVVTITHITDWIEKKLTLEFQKVLVMPNMDDLPIPIMDPGFLPQRRDS